MSNNITELNRANLREIREKLEAALKSAGLDGLGLSVTMGRCSFTASSASFKVEVAVRSSNGTVLSQTATAFSQMARFYGLAATDLGRTFKLFGHVYKVCGLKSRARSLPILATREDGKTFKFGAETVKALLASA